MSLVTEDHQAVAYLSMWWEMRVVPTPNAFDACGHGRSNAMGASNPLPAKYVEPLKGTANMRKSISKARG